MYPSGELEKCRFFRKTPESDKFFAFFLKKGHAPQAFHGEAFKKRYKKGRGSPGRGTAPPLVLHGTAPACRADGDILPPDRQDQFRHGKPFVTAAEPLAPLKPEDQLQVPGFHPVIKEAIVADLLETGREHMHQETPDKLFMAEGDLTFWFSRLFPPGTEGDLRFRNGKDPAVGDGDPVGITAKVFDGIAKPVEGLLDVRAPVLFIEGVFES